MKKAVTITFICLAFAINNTVFAIDLDDNNFFQMPTTNNAAYDVFAKSRENMVDKENAINSENSLDPDHYYIGGGDIFSISVIGLPSIRYMVEINQQGDMYIPELGLLKLGKIKLSEAQAKIAVYIQEKLKKQNTIYVQLVKVKSATVSINGAVEKPGTYVLSGGVRILDVIRSANKETMPSINDCDFREVLCKNKDSLSKIDVFNYLLKNDFSGNPYIYPGDNISLLYATKRIFLNSQAKSGISGWVPIKENETLAEFLSFLRFDSSVDTALIYYQSMGNGQRFIKTVSRNDAASIILQDKDIVTLPEKKNYSPVFLVSVGGEVARPGTYSIIRDSTTVQDVLAIAGGVTFLADMDRAVILRNYKIIEQEQQSKNTGTIEKAQESKALRPEMISALENMAIMSDYSVLQLHRFGTTTKLEANDRIVVPVKDKFVYISGAVKQPGAYEHVPGKKKSYYIKKAGGYTGKASRSNVFGMRYYERVCQQTDLSEIFGGDIIVVPESQQGKTMSMIVFPVISMVLTTIGTIVTIITISTSK